MKCKSAKWCQTVKLGHKTSSPDTQSLRVQMPECVNYSRKWLCLDNKYFLTSTSTSTQYNRLSVTLNDLGYNSLNRKCTAPEDAIYFADTTGDPVEATDRLVLHRYC